MLQVNVHEAKTTLSKLLEKAHAGEEIIVAKAGKPYARLVPLELPAERIAGRYAEPVPPGFLIPSRKKSFLHGRTEVHPGYLHPALVVVWTG